MFSSVQSLSRVWSSATPWTVGRQVSLFITNSRSLLRFMYIELMMPSNYLICHPVLLLPSIFPSIRVFSTELFASGDQIIGVSASTSVLPVNTQDWSPLGWTGWIFLQSKGRSRVFSNTTVSVANQETGHSGFSKVIFLNTDQLKWSKLMYKKKEKRLFKVYVVIPNFLTYINWSFTRREKRELIHTTTRKNRKVTH